MTADVPPTDAQPDVAGLIARLLGPRHFIGIDRWAAELLEDAREAAAALAHLQGENAVLRFQVASKEENIKDLARKKREHERRKEAAEARVARLEEVLRKIAAPASVMHGTAEQMRKAWRKIAVERIDLARAELDATPTEGRGDAS